MPARYVRALGYARVSSEEQAKGASLGDQQAAIRAHAQSRSLSVAHVYVEAEGGIYEKFERREQVQALMREVRRGDLVLVDKLDRWSRDPEFTYRSVRELLALGAGVYFFGEHLDPSTPEGDTMLTWRVAMAREEHKRIKERMVGTRQRLRDRGYYAEGLPPFGYERSLPRGHRGPETKNTLRIRDRDAVLVRDVFRRCIAGASIADIVRHLTRVWPARAWDKKSVGRMLRNRVYLGEVRGTSGTWIKGRHPAIITPDVFARAVAALEGRKLGGRRTQDGSRTETWLLRTLGVCARCGSRLKAMYGGGTAPGVYARDYYACRRRPACPVPLVPVTEADAAVGALVVPHLTELRAELAKGPEPATVPRGPNLEARKAKLQRKRERFLEAFGDGTVTKDELRAVLAKLDADRGALDALEAESSRRAPLQSADVRRAVLGRVESLRRAWDAASAQERRSVLGLVAHKVGIARGTAPVPEWLSLEEMAVEWPETNRGG